MKTVTSASTACVARASRFLLLAAVGFSAPAPASTASPVSQDASGIQEARVLSNSFRSKDKEANGSHSVAGRMGPACCMGSDAIAIRHQFNPELRRRAETDTRCSQTADGLMRCPDGPESSAWRSFEESNATSARTVPPTLRVDLSADPSSPPGALSGGANDAAAQTRHRGRQTSEFDLGLQSRLFAKPGLTSQRRIEGSVSFELEHFRSWDRDRQRLTVTPFLRVDSQDSDRTHFDLRELFWTYVGEDWDLHLGARRVFWGVTEFHHLVDIVNQTDLVENIDTEDKLGQPMVQLSLIRDWGTLDVFALAGFRERTFAGRDGRFRGPLEIDRAALFESSAENLRTDFALRWSHQLGPVEIGVHHFSGTSRDPIFLPRPAHQVAVRPYYPVIDQSGLDALAIQGDWSFKLEGMRRSGFGDRYTAFNLGVERTLVGILDTRADLGFVAEFMYDERGDEAFNTLFERDLALGGRFAFNDFADTQALIGVIADTQNGDLIFSVEATRQFGPGWSLSLEARVFQGGRSPRLPADVSVLEDADFKSAWLQDDDYLQIEFKKFF